MSKTAFIDLQGQWNGKEAVALHIFSYRAGGYSFEKTVEIPADSLPPAGFDGAKAFSLSLPLGLLNFRILKFPFSDKQKLKGVIPFELDGVILGGSENVVFDFVVLGESGNVFDVLVAYIEKRSLKDILTRLASMGMDPQVVTSLELRHALDRGTEDLGAHLVNPEPLSREGRIGSAAKELSAPVVNLRTGPFAYTKDEMAVRKRFKVTAVLSFLLALMINVDLAFIFISAKKESASLKKEMRTIYSGLFPDDKKITDELYQMKSRMKELKERGELMTGISPLLLMKDLSQRTMPGVVVDEINMDRDLITIKGEASAMDRIDALRARLSEFLRDVSVSDIKTSVDGKVRFTAVAKGYKGLTL